LIEDAGAIPQASPLLAVSLHDVAPQTWPACERLLALLDAVAAIPLTLLVVPDYHREGLRAFDQRYHAALDQRLARGDELALHGWTHLDELPLDRGVLDTLRRTRLTNREGEFAALSRDEARARLHKGLHWFERNGWPVQGFVAPAWLLGPGAREALEHLPLRYTTTRTEWLLLREKRSVRAPTLVYSARSASRRRASLLWNRCLLARVAGRPLVRLALHPIDVLHSDICANIERVLPSLLLTREALTKAQVTSRLAGSDAGLATALK